MPTTRRPRFGSLQFWPRKKAARLVPNVNWSAIKTDKKGLLGFIGYKVGMTSVYIKDNTPDSMIKGKKTVVPGTIIECPEMKIYSVRFYNNDNKLIKDFIVSFDEELKRKLKKPKKIFKAEELNVTDYKDVRVIVYSVVKKTGIKKSPDLIEMALGGSKEDKMNFIKEKIGKTISLSEVFPKGLVDIRGVTRGFGTQGPVARMGIGLKASKSEKGQRRPGSLAPWHPARVTFHTPLMGQTGYHTRVIHNNVILYSGKIAEKNINPKQGFNHYGNIMTDFMILQGSAQGPKKRQLLLTPASRPSLRQAKRVMEFIELR